MTGPEALSFADVLVLLVGTPSWPGMFLSAYQESAVIQEIGQAFAADGISTKIQPAEASGRATTRQRSTTHSARGSSRAWSQKRTMF
ncbi:hypothetical protein ABZ802_05830 [Streptomyces sp. NPDC047737]|uniref:hypothetical protein n=1 Tax=unclassified Streptomyces TaxID=2593676 RepID=UPI0033C4465B